MNGLQHLLAILAFLAAFAIALVIGSIGIAHKFGVLEYDLTMKILLEYGFLVPVGAAIAAGLTIFLALIRRKGAGVMTAIMALIFACAAGYLPYQFRTKAETLPAINDVSTDTLNPPTFIALEQQHIQQGAAATYDPSFAEKQKAAYPDLVTKERSESPAALYGKLHGIVKDQLRWLVAEDDAVQGRLEATVVSEWFGFKEDVVIRVTSDGTGSKLDIRSASRQGKVDYGANADNIRAILEKLN